MKSSLDIPNEFYDLISKKLLNDSDQNSWINCMKQFVNILFLKEPHQISATDFLMKFLRSLSEEINWPVENLDYQTKLNDHSWRKIFIRLLASINTLLTHRVKKYEFINISTIKKFQKKLILNDEFDNENSLSFEDDEEIINNDDDIQQDLNLLQQQHSDLEHLEQELLQTNSFFYSIEKWLEMVRNIFMEINSSSSRCFFRFSLFMKIIHCMMRIWF
jgi:hypothetical protein